MGFGYGVYFSERGRNRVIRWDPDSGQTDIVAGEPKDQDRTQKLNDPYGLAFDKDGNLLIADKLNCRIVRLKNGRLEEFQVRDTTGHRKRLPTSPRPYVPSHSLASPAGLFSCKDGSLLCAYFNENMVYRIFPDGRLDPVLGILRSRAYSISSPKERVAPGEVENEPVVYPTSAVELPDGAILTIERYFQIVREFHPKKGLNSLFPFSRMPDFASQSEAPAEAAIEEYHPAQPGGFALDAKGNLYLGELQHGCVLAIDRARRRIRRVVQTRAPNRGEIRGICALTFGSDGTAWVVDGGAAAVEAYQPTDKGPWKSLGVKLENVQGQPLDFAKGGCGIVTGK
jgi:hypothetical protein